MGMMNKILFADIQLIQKQYRRFLLHCFFYVPLSIVLFSCAPAPAATPFIPPTNIAPENTTPQVEITFATPTVGEETANNTETTPINLTSTEIPASPTPTCFNSLRYVGDVNYPDGTVLTPGESFEKQWLVENNGSCDWGSSYRLKYLDGAPMAATGESAIFPARTGSEATLSIQFTAPTEPGVYRSTWQAYDPLGQPFGDTLYVEIIVQSP